MGYEPIDAEYEEYENRLYDEFYNEYRKSERFSQDVDEVIEDVLRERIPLYYLAKPYIAKESLDLLNEAKELYRLAHYSASQVFGGAAIEVAFKEVLLKPIVYGFVYSETIANMIVEIFSKSVREIGKFQKLLIHIIKEFGDVDITQCKPNNSSKSIWEEASDVRDQRNNLLHKATQATKEQADQAILVASYVLENIFPKIISNLALHLDKDYRIYQKIPGGIILRKDEITALRARRHADLLSSDESILFATINQSLAETERNRLAELGEKRTDETLTPDEHQELLALQQRLDALHAARMKALSELAAMRGVTLTAVMEQLGIEFPIPSPTETDDE